MGTELDPGHIVRIHVEPGHAGDIYKNLITGWYQS